MQPRQLPGFQYTTAAVDPAQYFAMRRAEMAGANAPIAQPRKKRNFWLDQVSTGTSIAGGLLGSLVAPIAGTAAGAGIGGALGESIENLIDPEGGNWGNVAKEGALSAVMGGGPLKLLKGGAAGARALATGADDVVGAASKAATTSMFNRGARVALPGATGAADSVGAGVNASLKTSIPGKMNDMGNKALASQYGTIGKNVARETDPVTTFSQLADIGLTKPADVERVSKLITGSDGLLTQAVANAASGAKPVSTTGFSPILKDAITSNGLVDSQAKAVKNTVTAQLNAMKKSGGSAESVLKAMRNLEKRAANLQGKGGNYGMPTPERIDQANVLLAVRDELQDRLYNVAGGNKNLQNVLTPELRESLISIAPGNAKWQAYIDSNVMGATGIDSLRSAQAPFVKAGKIIKEADVNSMTFGGRSAGFNGGTIPSTVANIAVDYLKNPAARAISGPLRSVGQFGAPITIAGKGNQGMKGALGIAGRLGATGIASGTQGGNETLDAALLDQSSGPNMLYNNMTPTANMNSAANTPNIANMQSPYNTADPLSSALTGGSQSPYSRENLMMDIQRDPQNADKYVEYYAMLDEVFNPKVDEASQKPLSQGQQERADLIKALDNTENVMAAGSINYGPVGARLEGVKSFFNAADPETLTFKNTVSGLRAAITKARAGASLTEGELRMLAKYTPNETDTEQVVRSKLAALRDLYGYQAPTGGSTLEDALMGAQQGYGI